MDQKTIISVLSSAGQWIKHLLGILYREPVKFGVNF